VGGIVAGVLVLFWSTGEAQMQESVKRSIEYVLGMETDCVLDHGYKCADGIEDEFLTPASLQRLIPGPYLAAWQVSYDDFRSMPDISDEQKALKHYKIGFTQNEDEYIVLFQALLLPEIVDGMPQGTIRATYGRSTKYWVDRKSLVINKRLFLK